MTSPTSTTQQQKSGKEAREEFDTKMLKLVSRLEARSSILFYKRVSKCMVTEAVQGPLAYSLEFPKEFIDLHSKKFGKDATFMTTEPSKHGPSRSRYVVSNIQGAEYLHMAVVDGRLSLWTTASKLGISSSLA